MIGAGEKRENFYEQVNSLHIKECSKPDRGPSQCAPMIGAGAKKKGGGEALAAGMVCGISDFYLLL